MRQWLRRLGERIDRIDRIDRDLVRSISDRPVSGLDSGLKILTTSADHGVLWFAIAAALAGRTGPTRRAALRGVLAIGATSFVANALAKPLLPRRRPAYEQLAPRRRLPLRERPGSSSFPSGHAASAAAFVTAAILECPAAAAGLAPLAAAVAYSRVHTGVHYPSDAAAGALLGAGLALATTHWWPVRPARPEAARPSLTVPALPSGAGLLILVNPGSGAGREDLAAEIRDLLPDARLLFPQPALSLVEALQAELDRAVEPIRALGVAGGDGTVAAVASVAARRRLPLAVIPGGTLNHFARDVGIPGLGAVATAVRAGSAVAMDLSAVRIDGHPPHWFVNTASLGGYPDLVRLREGWQPRWGRWPAASAALVAVLRRARPLTVSIDGQRRRIWLLFVGNGTYQPRGFAPSVRPRLDTGLLDVRFIRADRRLSRSRFVLAAVTGTLRRSHTCMQADRVELDVEVLGAPVAIAADGEVVATGHRFRFGVHRGPLTVYRPPG